MAIDASVYNALMQPRKSAFDYANQYEDQAFKREQMDAQRQQNALSLQQAKQSQADDQALRNYLSGGADLGSAEGQAGLYRAAPKAAAGILKDRAALAKEQAQTKQAEAAAGKTNFEAALAKQKAIADLAGSATDQASWARARNLASLLGADVSQIPEQFDPATAQGIASTAMSQAQRLEQHWKQLEFGLKGANEIMTPDGNGGFKLNQPLIDAKKQVAQAGKTAVNLNVNTAKSLTGEMAQGLGKQLDSSLAGANAAVSTINTAGQIRDLVNSGKVITGPGADQRVVMARIGDLLGVGGKDNAEKLANTAALVQNLAKTELDSAQSMKGQGQITEAERAILRKAAAGQLNMSGPELISLSNALEKTARGRIANHQSQVQKLGALDGAAPLVPFYSVEAPAAAQPAGPAPKPGSSPQVIDFSSLK